MQSEGPDDIVAPHFDDGSKQSKAKQPHSFQITISLVFEQINILLYI